MCLRKTGLWTSVPVYARIGRDLVIDKGDKERTQAGWLAGGCRNWSSEDNFFLGWVLTFDSSPPLRLDSSSICPSVRLSVYLVRVESVCACLLVLFPDDDNRLHHHRPASLAVSSRDQVRVR
jgi:hypothetical protein